MAVRIRLYPQTGVGMNGMGGAVSASTFFNQKLQSQSQVSNLRLQYERALWGEKLDKVRLEERLKNPYLGAYGGTGLGSPYGAVPIGGVPLGMGVPMGYGQQGLPIGYGQQGIPGGFGGSGQTNITNQTSAGAGNQSVSNSNSYNVSSVAQNPGYPQMPYGFGGGFGSGGFLSGLLGALI